MNVYYRKHEHGFTLVELLIVMAIFGLMAGMGVLQFRASQAHQELDRATRELAADIRWMQQLSANDATPRLSEATPLIYRYRLTFDTDGYEVCDDNEHKILKRRQFSDHLVRATVLVPDGVNKVDMTFYSYDLDRLKNTDDPASLENAAYQVQLVHDITKTARYVNVDSRVGRVWVTREAAETPL